MKFSNVSLLFLAAGTTISARDFNPRRRPLGRKMNRKSLRTQRAASLHPRQAEEAAACMKSCAESDPSYGDKIIDFEHDVDALKEEARNLEGVTEEDMQQVAEGLMADHGLSMDTLREVGMNCAESCGVPPPHGPPERAAVFDDRNAKGAMKAEANCMKSCVEGDPTFGAEIIGFEDDMKKVVDGARNLEGVTPEDIEEVAEEAMTKHNLSKDILEEVGENCASQCGIGGPGGE